MIIELTQIQRMTTVNRTLDSNAECIHRRLIKCKTAHLTAPIVNRTCLHWSKFFNKRLQHRARILMLMSFVLITVGLN